MKRKIDANYSSEEDSAEPAQIGSCWIRWERLDLPSWLEGRLFVRDMPADGDCFFHAVASALDKQFPASGNEPESNSSSSTPSSADLSVSKLRNVVGREFEHIDDWETIRDICAAEEESRPELEQKLRGVSDRSELRSLLQQRGAVFANHLLIDLLQKGLDKDATHLSFVIFHENGGETLLQNQSESSKCILLRLRGCPMGHYQLCGVKRVDGVVAGALSMQDIHNLADSSCGESKPALP